MPRLTPRTLAIAGVRGATAFAIGDSYAITTEQAVRGADADVELIFPAVGRPFVVAAEVVEVDGELDIAVLRLRRPLPDRLQPLALALGAVPWERAVTVLSCEPDARLRWSHARAPCPLPGGVSASIVVRRDQRENIGRAFAGAPAIVNGHEVLAVLCGCFEGEQDWDNGVIIAATRADALADLIAEYELPRHAGAHIPPAGVPLSRIRWVQRFDAPWALGAHDTPLVLLDFAASSPVAGLNAASATVAPESHELYPDWSDSTAIDGSGSLVVSFAAEPDGTTLDRLLQKANRRKGNGALILRVLAQTPAEAAAVATARSAQGHAIWMTRFYSRPPDGLDLVRLRHAADTPGEYLREAASSGSFMFATRGGLECDGSRRASEALAAELDRATGAGIVATLVDALGRAATRYAPLTSHIAGLLGAMPPSCGCPGLDLFADDPTALHWWLAGRCATDGSMPDPTATGLDRAGLRRFFWIAYTSARPRLAVAADAWEAMAGVPHPHVGRWLLDQPVQDSELPFFLRDRSDSAAAVFAARLRAALIPLLARDDPQPLATYLADAPRSELAAIGIDRPAGDELPIVRELRRACRNALVDLAVVA